MGKTSLLQCKYRHHETTNARTKLSTPTCITDEVPIKGQEGKYGGGGALVNAVSVFHGRLLEEIIIIVRRFHLSTQVTVSGRPDRKRAGDET